MLPEPEILVALHTFKKAGAPLRAPSLCQVLLACVWHCGIVVWGCCDFSTSSQKVASNCSES